jgi:hypothetical protein
MKYCCLKGPEGSIQVCLFKPNLKITGLTVFKHYDLLHPYMNEILEQYDKPITKIKILVNKIVNKNNYENRYFRRWALQF